MVNGEYGVIAFITVLGVVLGSFFNVMVQRSLKGKDWVKGKSMCDKCGHELGLLDLIPILSFVCLRGKCRYCKKPINWMHTFSECMFGLCFLVVTLGVGEFDLNLLIALIVVTVICINTLSDILERVTLTIPVYIGIIFTVIIRFIYLLNTFSLDVSLTYLIDVVFMAVILTLLSKLVKNKVGEGDFDILFLFFVANGLNFVASSIFLGSCASMIVIVPMMVTGKLGRKSKVPFVPILLVGYVASILLQSGGLI